MGTAKEQKKKISSGFYNVTESGLEYEHKKTELLTPKDGKEFLDRFRQGFELNILEQKENDNELIFEMIGCDVSFANALRRILIAEVPTVALEYVYMWNNTSLIHDEVLAHRLGLVPLNVDARLFDEMEDDNDDPTDRNTVVFQLKVSCPRKPASSKHKKRHQDDDNQEDNDDDENNTNNKNDDIDDNDGFDSTDIDRSAVAAAAVKAATSPKHIQEAIDTPGRPYTKHVYSKDLVWLPQGDQEERFPDGIHPVHDDILLAKLRPGQEIELEAHGRRGIGKDHAKYSPVATASYRLYTEVEIVEPIYDELAEELVHLYEPGVFELVPVTSKDSSNHHRVEAKVCNTYACTVSRNYMRNPILARSIMMKRIPNHFIFSVESVGMQKPSVLVAEALRILQEKCYNLLDLTKASQKDQHQKF